jgi:hypothetical protein
MNHVSPLGGAWIFMRTIPDDDLPVVISMLRGPLTY